MMKPFCSVLAAFACMAATGSSAILVNYNSDNGAGTPSVLETEATADLSGRPEYQNVAGPVIFRIYLYDDSKAATRYVSIGNVTLSADLVPVPEPSACVLALAATALTARRRRF